MENPENQQDSAADEEARRDSESPQGAPPPARSAIRDLPPAAPPSLPQKSPILAAFLSFIPGVGNVYNGLYQRAVLFFMVYVTFFTLAVNSDDEEKAFLIPCLVFTWFFNVFDAYRQATLLNYGYVAAAAEEKKPGIAGWGLAPGVFLLALGLYGLLREHLDLSRLVEEWPWALIALGFWMIFKYFWDRKKAEEQAGNAL